MFLAIIISYLFSMRKFYKSLACINQTTHSDMKESLSSWNQIYEMLFAIQKLLKLSKNSKNGERQILELLTNKLQFETIENFHCIFEDMGIKYLDLIREKDLSFFDNPNSNRHSAPGIIKIRLI